MKRITFLLGFSVVLMAAQLGATGQSSSSDSPSNSNGLSTSAAVSQTKSATTSSSTAAAVSSSAAATTVSPTASAKAATVTAAAAPETGTAVSPENPDHKQVWLAKTLAVLPGIVFHGAGNMYAGNWTTGLGLFVVGTAGAAAAIYEVGQDRNYFQNDFSGSSSSGVSIPDDLTPIVGNIGIILVGTVAFLWTGWDDLAGCGMAVDRYNKQLDEDKGTVSMLPANGGGALLTYNKSF